MEGMFLYFSQKAYLILQRNKYSRSIINYYKKK